MGGYGSGYNGTKKWAVEECLILSANSFRQHGSFTPGHTGTLTWTSNGEKIGAISYETRETDVMLIYTTDGVPVRYPVGIWETHPNFGGIRHYFICPIVGCKSFKVDKLYLPPKAKYFGCRRCYDLTYQSCRESHKWDGMYRMLAANTGFPVSAVKRTLKQML